ncbi:MAG: type I-U CRISPR-associated RAMP protein Csb1/Cas7u [Thermoflexales bacterium]
MSDQNNLVSRFDDLLDESKGVVAVVLREWLLPAQGRDAAFFPPTFPRPQDPRPQDRFSDEWLGYNIDVLPDGRRVCLVDTIGSQANRIEPKFKYEPYCKLVPQVHIKLKSNDPAGVNLLDVGHRAADALVRFSSGSEKLKQAFQAILERADYEPLAKIAPTSILFGCWDSRGTQVKIQRVFGSEIRAFGIVPLHRSAQYRPPVRYIDEGVLDEPDSEKKKEAYSEQGFLDVPSSWSHGGVILLENGEIRRDARLNLVAVRALSAGSKDKEATQKLRRYILGLGLVALTLPQDGNLREGCLLVRDAQRPPKLECVYADGRREPFEISHEDALEFARQCASDFVVGESCEFDFNAGRAKEQLAKSKEERKKARGKEKVSE